jgi:hypothetical protein
LGRPPHGRASQSRRNIAGGNCRSTRKHRFARFCGAMPTAPSQRAFGSVVTMGKENRFSSACGSAKHPAVNLQSLDSVMNADYSVFERSGFRFA